MSGAQFAVDTEALRTSERALTLIESHREECRQNRDQIIGEIRLNREDSNQGRAALHLRIDRIWYLALMALSTLFLFVLAGAGTMAWAILSRVH